MITVAPDHIQTQTHIQ